jgi:hypothetical protein
MGKNKKNDGMPRQEVKFCRPLGWAQEGIFAKIALLACVCFDGQCSIKTSKVAPEIAKRLNREVKFATQAGSLPN